tara:strand:- start:55 stop:825 length:771 start_codon:yes stop_codon:yes gene_type:complete
MAKTYKKRKTIVNKKRKKKGTGHRDFTHKLLSKVFNRDIPVELFNQMTSQNREMFSNLDNELYIKVFLEANKLIMTEQNIKKYAKKSQRDIDLQLNYLNELKKKKEAKEAREKKEKDLFLKLKETKEKKEKEAEEKKKEEEEELIRRKTRAEEFEPIIQDLIESKNEELKQLKQIQKQPSKRETRSHKTSAQDNKIDKLEDKLEGKLEGEIYKLKGHLRALRYRIDNNFKGLSPKQDDMFYNYIDKYRTKSYEANY